MLTGEWKWVYAAGGWDGRLTFTKEKDGNFTFVGTEYKVNETGLKEPLYEMTDGKAVLIDRNTLRLESDVLDVKFNEKFHWKETAPFVLIPAFRGILRPIEPQRDKYIWGMTIYKWPGAE